MNIWNGIGRLVRDPELKYTPSGVAMVKFTLAVNRNYKNQQGQQEADFISCIAFNKLAENLSNYQKKGNRIAVSGQIQTGSYENQQGQKVYTTDVIANNIEFLDYRSENAQNSSNFASNNQGNTNYQPPQQNANMGQNLANNKRFNSNPIDLDEDNLPF